MNHFARRCRERGITSTCPDQIARELRQAVAGGGTALEVAQRVMPCLRGGADIWRFRVREGIFYAVIGPDGNPRTILTQEMIRKKKWARKRQKRGQVRPGLRK